jgi:LisH
MSKSPSQPAGDGVKTDSDMSGQQQVSQSQSGQNATSNGQQSGGTHSSQELDHIVAQYLQKKGYRQTEAMLRREANSKTIPLSEMSSRFRPQDDPSMSDHVLFYSEAEAGNPDAYDISYKSLRGWIENSLDWYKVCRLHNVLFGAKKQPSNECQRTSPNYDQSCFLSLYIRISTLYRRSCTSKVINTEISVEI